MSNYTRKLKRETIKTSLISTLNVKKEGYWKSGSSGSTQTMRRKHIDFKKGLFLRRNGFSLARINQDVKQGCCDLATNESSHFSQNSYYNLLRRKKMCIKDNCNSSKITTYKHFTLDDDTFILNKKINLLKTINKNCPSSVNTNGNCYKNVPRIEKKLPYKPASEHIQNKKLKRCAGFGCDANGKKCTKLELPITQRRSCRHI
jgi:hypothetical protein